MTGGSISSRFVSPRSTFHGWITCLPFLFLDQSQPSLPKSSRLSCDWSIISNTPDDSADESRLLWNVFQSSFTSTSSGKLSRTICWEPSGLVSTPKNNIQTNKFHASIHFFRASSSLRVFIILKHMALFIGADHRGNAPPQYSILPQKTLLWGDFFL